MRGAVLTVSNSVGSEQLVSILLARKPFQVKDIGGLVTFVKESHTQKEIERMKTCIALSNSITVVQLML